MSQTIIKPCGTCNLCYGNNAPTLLNHCMWHQMEDIKRGYAYKLESIGFPAEELMTAVNVWFNHNYTFAQAVKA